MQNQPSFKFIKTHKHQLEMQKNQSQRNKNRNQHTYTPPSCPRTDGKDQDNSNLVDLNARMTNTDADHQDTVTDPSPNPITTIDFSGVIVGATNDFEGKTSLNVPPDKQTPDTVRRCVLSQALLSPIKSGRSTIGSVDSGSDMSPDVANIIDDTLTRAAMVIHTVANIGKLGSHNSNQSSQDDVTMQEDIYIYGTSFEKKNNGIR